MHPIRPLVFLLVALVATCLPMAPAVSAQSAAEWDGGREQMTRGELEELRDRLQSAVESTAYSGSLRDEARRSIEGIEARLRDGDFRVGDRIDLRIVGEEALTDTFTVRQGPAIDLPDIGRVSLDGILRSELEDHVTSEVSRFIRQPEVRAQTLVRILVQGEVEEPGFYLAPAETLISDLLMMAGGPTREAQLTDLRVERGSARIWEGEAMETAVIQGRTIDQLNLQAGDRVVVPQEVQRDGVEWLRIITMTAAPIITVGIALATIF